MLAHVPKYYDLTIFLAWISSHQQSFVSSLLPTRFSWVYGRETDGCMQINLLYLRLELTFTCRYRENDCQLSQRCENVHGLPIWVYRTDPYPSLYGGGAEISVYSLFNGIGRVFERQ